MCVYIIYTYIYIYKLSVFDSDDTKKKPYVHCGPSSRTSSKSAKKKKKAKRDVRRY